MKKLLLGKNLFFLFLIQVSLLSAQSIGINTTGAIPSINAILDLNTGNSHNSGLIVPNVTLGASLATFNPPIANAPTAGDKGMLVYNSVATNQPIGYYYWNGATWVVIGGAGGGLTNANNGLSLSGTIAQLGGPLIQNTTITLSGFTQSVVGSSETTFWSTKGQVSVGNVAPDAKAVVDLTNATNLGLMLPGMTTANLPAITNAENGLFVFNTTLGCPEYANNSVWIPLGAHGTANFTYTGAVQVFSIPQCVITITITATGGAGGGSGLYLGGNGATVTQVFTVSPGHTLSVVVGNSGTTNDYSGGGGGGSYVWDNASTNYPMIAAGGGGGGAYTGAGANASTTLVPTASAGGCGAGGAGGAAGAEGSTTKPGAGGGGTGWNTVTGNPAASSATVGAGGNGEPSGFVGGGGATNTFPLSSGGYGGGGGGGYNTTNTWGGGGGGGGYNGGGGGNAPSNANQWGGGGGGSGYYNGVFPYTTGGNFVAPTSVSAGNTGVGSVLINY